MLLPNLEPVHGGWRGTTNREHTLRARSLYSHPAHVHRLYFNIVDKQYLPGGGRFPELQALVAKDVIPWLNVGVKGWQVDPHPFPAEARYTLLSGRHETSLPLTHIQVRHNLRSFPQACSLGSCDTHFQGVGAILQALRPAKAFVALDHEMDHRITTVRWRTAHPDKTKDAFGGKGGTASEFISMWRRARRIITQSHQMTNAVFVFTVSAQALNSTHFLNVLDFNWVAFNLFVNTVVVSSDGTQRTQIGNRCAPHLRPTSSATHSPPHSYTISTHPHTIATPSPHHPHTMPTPSSHH